MKKQIVSVMLALAFAGAQAQAPPVVVRGSVGPSGTFPFRNATPITMTDANHAMVYAETSAGFVRLTGTLTAQRDVIEITLTNQHCFQNATTGSQNVRVIGPSGTGVVIANGTYACVQGDGTNYVTAPSGGSGFSGQTPGCAPKAATATTSTGSLPICDDGTTTTATHPIVAPSLISGTPTASAKAACTPISGSHCAVFDESSTAGVPAAGVDYSRADSVTHRFVQSVNGGAESPVVTDLTLASPPGYGTTTPAPSIATQINSGSYQAQANQTGGGNNGIANSAAALPSGGAIVAEPTYGSTEEPNNPDATLPTSAFAAKTQLLDLRYGSRTDMYVNPARNEQEGNQQYIGAARYCYNTTLPNLDITNLFSGVQCSAISQFNYLAGYDPGYSGGSGGGVPMGDNALLIQQNSWMAGVHSGVVLVQNIYSGSDQVLGFSTNAVVKPALIRPSQEGTKYRDQVFESSTGVATVATGGSHATTIGMASQGGDFGIFTIAVDAQAGNVRSGTTGTCTTSSPATNVNVVTCPVSGFTPVATTASGTLGTGFTFTPTDPTGTVPTLHAVTGTATVSTGSLNIGDLMCIPDTDYYEQVRVTAVSPNLQYSSYYPHPSGTLFYAGGECGGQIEFTSKTLTVGGNPKRYLQQVISSTVSSITFAYKQQAQYNPYSEDSASIKLYEGAMVQGLQPPTCRNCPIAGLILQANNGAWTSADAVEDDNNISAAYSLGQEVINTLYNPFAFYEHNDTFNQGIGSALPNTASWWGGAINGPGYPGNTCATTADHIGFRDCGGPRNAASAFLFKGAWGPFWVGDAPLTTATPCGASNAILTECGEANGATPTLHPIWSRQTNGDAFTYDPTTRTLNLVATHVKSNGVDNCTTATCAAAFSGTTNFFPKFTSSTVLGNSNCDEGVTASGAFFCNEIISAPRFTPSNGSSGMLIVQGDQTGTSSAIAQLDIHGGSGTGSVFLHASNNQGYGLYEIGNNAKIGVGYADGDTLPVGFSASKAQPASFACDPSTGVCPTAFDTSGNLTLPTINATTYSSGTLANGMVATTQSPGDNTTKVATDAFVLANATALPVYGSTGTAVTTPHIVTGTVSISANLVTVTLSGAAVFTSSGTYGCTTTPQVTATWSGTGQLASAPTAGSTFTIDGLTTGFTGTAYYQCIGN